MGPVASSAHRAQKHLLLHLETLITLDFPIISTPIFDLKETDTEINLQWPQLKQSPRTQTGQSFC